MSAAPAPTDPSEPLAARLAAFDLLTDCLENGIALDAAVTRHLSQSRLPARDRAFARALATTAIRRRGDLLAALRALMDRPLPKRAQGAARCLDLGLVQILFFGVADHAAVDTTLRLLDRRGRAGDRPLKGLLNAVLRRAAREREDILARLDADPALNLPGWLRKRWTRTYGAATTAGMASLLRREPPLDLTPRDPADAAALAEATGAVKLPSGSLRLDRPVDPAALPGFAEGRFWVQDAAAALPARLLASRLPAGAKVIDLCAAPGGKTLQLAAAGIAVTSLDRSQARLDRLRDNLARTGLAADIIAADALAWQPPVPAAGVLLDAPCSATGTLRRRPDVAWSKSADDIRVLAELQGQLLAAAADMVAPAGTLVYCVCSLEREEGEDRIAAFLEARTDWARAAIAPDELPGLEAAVTADGDLRLLPVHLGHCGGNDGFFVARLVRKR